MRLVLHECVEAFRVLPGEWTGELPGAHLGFTPISAARHLCDRVFRKQHRYGNCSRYFGREWKDQDSGTMGGLSPAALRGARPLARARLFGAGGGLGKTG